MQKVGGVTQIHIHWHILKVLALVLMILARVFMVLALVLMVLTALALMLLILAQSYHIFIDGFWGYLQSKKIMSDSLSDSVNILGLRDASASKNVFLWSVPSDFLKGCILLWKYDNVYSERVFRPEKCLVSFIFHSK